MVWKETTKPIFTEEAPEDYEPVKEKKPKKKRVVDSVLNRRGQIETFWEEQPFFYDESKLFWLWDNEEKKWELSDEVNFLNSIQESMGVETINSKTKTELVEGFKQVGRLHKPKPIEKSWVQFKNRIFDIKTGRDFEASPDYFVTNPIPHNVGENEDTPTMDKLFIEWVGEKYKQTLYEFLAYNICSDKFMQRLFGFCGGGSNGKGTFIKLNYKFLGENNCVSSEIKALSERQFEAAVLYRKLLCVMGEVSHDDLRNTNQLKKLAGEDKLSFEMKGKMPFTADNTATAVCLTNSLPITPDKSLGFYRKWLIIDFPNQFNDVGTDVLGKIPDKEFQNLAKKCLRILKELYTTPKFTNEGSFEERMKRYEQRSNPVMRFVEEYCEEDSENMVLIREFTNSCNEYLKSKHLRIMTPIQIGKILRNEGFIVGNRKINDISGVVILNLSLNNKEKLLELSELSKSPLVSLRESTENCNSFNSSNSIPQEMEAEVEKTL
jgi:P4 family phage/plasmid primase-like protien